MLPSNPVPALVCSEDTEAPPQSSVSAAIICVNYNGADPTLAFVRSLSVLRGFSSVPVVIVDSASTDDSVARLRRECARYPNCRVTESADNLGYFGGARLALEDMLSDVTRMADWVIVCNNDVAIHDAEFFEKLAALDCNVGVIAPRIVCLPGNVDQNPFMTTRPTRVRQWQLRAVNSFYAVAATWDLASRWKQSLRARKSAASISSHVRKRIYAAHGAFMIFSRRFFEAGGRLDSNLFLYGEEITVAETCRRLGLATVYAPELFVFHNEHSSTGKRITPFSFACQKRAINYITSQYWR